MRDLSLQLCACVKCTSTSDRMRMRSKHYHGDWHFETNFLTCRHVHDPSYNYSEYWSVFSVRKTGTADSFRTMFWNVINIKCVLEEAGTVSDYFSYVNRNVHYITERIFDCSLRSQATLKEVGSNLCYTFWLSAAKVLKTLSIWIQFFLLKANSRHFRGLFLRGRLRLMSNTRGG